MDACEQRQDPWRPSGGTSFAPTPEGWAAFRRAVAETLEAQRRGETSIMYPILGGSRYWYDPPAGAARLVALAIDEDASEVRATLADGRRVSAPLSWWPILRDASAEERARHEIAERGDMVLFPLLNTEILVDHLLLCRGGADPDAFASACLRSDEVMLAAGTLLYRAAAERAEEVGQWGVGERPPDWAMDAVLAEARWWTAGGRPASALPPVVRWSRFPVVPLREALRARLGALEAAAAAEGATERGALLRHGLEDLRCGVDGADGDRPVLHLGGGVVSDPAVLCGTPAPTCTRVPVWLILSHLASGMSVADILAPDVLPHLTEADVEASLRAASAVLDETRAPLVRHVRMLADADEEEGPPDHTAEE